MWLKIKTILIFPNAKNSLISAKCVMSPCTTSNTTREGFFLKTLWISTAGTIIIIRCSLPHPTRRYSIQNRARAERAFVVHSSTQPKLQKSITRFENTSSLPKLNLSKIIVSHYQRLAYPPRHLLLWLSILGHGGISRKSNFYRTQVNLNFNLWVQM